MTEQSTTSYKASPVTILADRLGIKGEWQDPTGSIRRASEQALKTVLASVGYDTTSEAIIQEAADEEERRPVKRSYVFDADSEGTHIILSALAKKGEYNWTLRSRQGHRYHGVAAPGEAGEHGSEGGRKNRLQISLPDLSAGYYNLEVESNGKHWRSFIIVAPKEFYSSPSLKEKVWGPLVHVASLRSSRNWGLGDLGDLKAACKTSIDRGAGLITVAPLQPVLTEKAYESDRVLYSALEFIDPVYIDVESVPEFQNSKDAQRLVFGPEAQKVIKTQRQQETVDLDVVRALKLRALEILFRQFQVEHLNRRSFRAERFRVFVHEQGDSLRMFALFEALKEDMRLNNEANKLSEWPAKYNSASNETVEEYARMNPERIERFCYIQWLAHEQLQEIGELCHRARLPVGIIYKTADWLDPEGFEAWRSASLVASAMKATTATADHLNMPAALALRPADVREDGYRYFVEGVRTSCRYAGAIYAPDLTRTANQFWISSGPDKEILKVDFHEEDMLAIMRVESHRAKTMVICPHKKSGDGMFSVEAALGEAGIVFSERAESIEQADGDSEASIRSSALLPYGERGHSLTSYWSGSELIADRGQSDIAMAARDSIAVQRLRERKELLTLLESEKLIGHSTAKDAAATLLTLELCTAVYSLISAREPQLLIIPLEDIAGLQTRGQKPNLAYERHQKLAVDTDSIFEPQTIKKLLDVLSRTRCSQSGESLQESLNSAVTAIIPRATYRFQFNKTFTIKDALKLLPYLEKLGVSHVYASPLLKARAGSMHGYDLISHRELNPEIGTQADYDELYDELHKRGMGLIMDMVPNHMGIGKENSWWMDVLENGPASQFADYFDIDWAPIKQELQGKVTIPVLGEAYGAILKSGQLKLRFEKENGGLFVSYYEHKLPLNPLSYPSVLNRRLDVLKERLGSDNSDVAEYRSIITALSHLPDHMDRASFSDRIREKSLQLKRLSQLCERNSTITEFIEQNLRVFDVVDGDRPATERMHNLLEAQAYRLVHWRVANDEINYRRFFDVNDLAAVRTEDPRVFAEMHDLIFRLVAANRLDGLRIDHPDGLYDPAHYFNQLQQKSAESLHSAFDPLHSDLPFYVIVEKILAPFERIEEDWAVHGTTGYDFLNELSSLLVAVDNEEEFTRIYTDFAGAEFDYEAMKHECKTIILDTVLASELNVLAHRLSQIAESSLNFRDITLNSLRNALKEVVLYFPVYRTYVTENKTDRTAHQYIDWALGRARRSSAATSGVVYDFIDHVLSNNLNALTSDTVKVDEEEFAKAITTFAMKFQQFTGPVMAKSIEDTLFYRYARFVCLNEVGGEPEKFGGSISSFHQKNLARSQRYPHSMLSTSTHDTKRSEDVRARLQVLSEIPKKWEQRLSLWARMNRSKKIEIDGAQLPDANDEYLIYQTLVGCLPMDFDVNSTDAFRERIEQYVIKAGRESKRFTSWINQDGEYEGALTGFVRRILTPGTNNAFLNDLKSFTATLHSFGSINSVVQTTLKMTCPGVPDVYQGTELYDLSLVDPDNRRPVDYKLREELFDKLASLDSGAGGRTALLQELKLNDGTTKLFVLSRLLRYRRAAEELFASGKYLPLFTDGAHSSNLFGFARVFKNRFMVVVVPRMVATLLKFDATDNDAAAAMEKLSSLGADAIWGDTEVELPEQLWGMKAVNLMSGKALDCGETLKAADLFKEIPVAILVSPEDAN